MRIGCGRILVAAGVLFLLALLAAGCGGQKPVIRLHDGEFESIWVNNAIAKFIIERGYGYPVETVAETTHEMQVAIQEGGIDLNLEGWQQNFMDWYNQQVDRGNIINLGMTYEDSSQVFVIPKWVADQYHIQTVFDVKDHWELFRDPQDPFKGVFYNCLIGWECAEVNKVKLEAYGLTRYYNVVSPGSSAALEAALSRPQRNGQPVFGYYWEPTPLMVSYEWYILEEPPYTDQCWEGVLAASEDDSLRPVAQACAYETIPIEAIGHSGLQKKAPDVVEMLRKMVVGLEPLNRTMGWAVENDVQNWERAAVYYLENHEDRWRTWVTSEAYEKIKEALEEARR